MPIENNILHWDVSFAWNLFGEKKGKKNKIIIRYLKYGTQKKLIRIIEIISKY
jgi:hypothetical protein